MERLVSIPIVILAALWARRVSKAVSVCALEGCRVSKAFLSASNPVAWQVQIRSALLRPGAHPSLIPYLRFPGQENRVATLACPYPASSKV